MAEFPCPQGDYTASRASEAEAALDLVDHLLKSHCKTDEGPLIDPTDYDQIHELLSNAAVRAGADVSAGPVDIKADIKARGGDLRAPGR